MRFAREETLPAVVVAAVCAVFAGALAVPGFGLVRALAGVAILLVFLGLSLRLFLRTVLPARSPVPLWTAGGIALDFLTSFVLLVLVSTVLSVGFLLEESLLVFILLGTCVALNVGTVLLSAARPAPSAPRRGVRRGVAGALCLLAAISTVIFVIFRWPNPYPSISGWDLNPALASVGWTLDHHGFSFLLIPPFPASSLVPYPASFNDFLAGYSLFLGVPPLAIFYYGVLAMLIAYAVGVFAIAYRLTGRTGSSLFAAIAILYLGTVLPETVRTPFFVTIDLIGQLLFFALLLFFLDDAHGLQRRRVIVLAGFAFLVYWYFYEIVVVTPLVAFMIGESSGFGSLPRQVRWFRRVALLTLAGVAGLAAAAEFLIPSLSGALSSSYPILSKVQTLVTTYAPLVLLLILLRGLGRRRRPVDPAVKGLRMSYLLEYVVVYLAIFLVPLSATYRVEFYFRSAAAIYLATVPLPTRAELREIAASVRSFLRRSPTPPMRTSPNARIGALALCAFLLFMLVLLPLQATQTEPYMSVDEYQAATWIHDNVPADAYVVTDPGTGYVFRAFSLRNASVYFLLPDGRSPEDISTLYPNLLTQLHDIFTSRTAARAQTQIEALGFPLVYIVISTRTVTWAHVGEDAIFDRPFTDVSPDQLLGTFSAPIFQVAFATPSVLVLTMR